MMPQPRRRRGIRRPRLARGKPRLQPRAGARASHADRRRRPPAQHGRALRDRGAATGRRRRRAHPDRRAAFALRPGTGGRRARRRLRSSRRPRRRGRRTTPRAPGGRGTTAASRRRRASRPWRATPPAPRGRTCGARPAGSGRYSGSTANTTPDVPSTIESGPGAVTPTPSAAAAQSPAPATSGDSSTGGSHSGGMSSAASTSSDQRRAGDVEEQRPRRVGDVGRPLAGQPKPHVVLGQADRVRSVRRSPARGGAARGASAP